MYCLLRIHRVLPAAHPPLYRRTAEELYLHLGASIGYWRGDIKGLMEDIGGQGQRGRLLGLIRAQCRLRMELGTLHCAGAKTAASLRLNSCRRQASGCPSSPYRRPCLAAVPALQALCAPPCSAACLACLIASTPA